MGGEMERRENSYENFLHSARRLLVSREKHLLDWSLAWKRPRLVENLNCHCSVTNVWLFIDIFPRSGYVSADILPDSSRALFTYYHEIGSLQDYLKQRCLNDTELLTLARSAANGLYCLHTEVLCTFKRPAIVHRNITSKNFLVNNRHECVISDFEVALTE